MTTTGGHEAPMAMIDRVASLLEVFHGRPRLNLAQISRHAQLPRSSAHRILQRLVELGWVERDGFQYGLGIRMFELGAQVVRQDRLQQAAWPFLHALHRSTGFTASLSILVAADVLHVQRIGDWPGTGEGWQPGGRQPAARTAPGHALLIRLDESEWPEFSFARPGIRSVAQLRKELDRVRDRGGVAVDVGGFTTDTTVVAAGVGPAEGGPQVALSLCGPVDAVRVDRAVNVVRMAAMEIFYSASGVTRLRRRAAMADPSPRQLKEVVIR